MASTRHQPRLLKLLDKWVLCHVSVTCASYTDSGLTDMRVPTQAATSTADTSVRWMENTGLCLMLQTSLIPSLVVHMHVRLCREV
jgi:hypothetical protein